LVPAATGGSVVPALHSDTHIIIRRKAMNSIAWNTSFENALAKSKTDGMLVFLDFFNPN
jgi:hypothetical protein